MDIVKRDPVQRLVYGYATTEALDSQGERVSKEAVEGALADYMKFANIREMHQPSAVGVAKEANLDEKGLFLCAKLVDDQAWKKVEEGVYKGFSLGGKKVAKVGDTVTQMRLTEISLVDRPANPEALITLFKLDESSPKDWEWEKTAMLAEIERLKKIAARQDVKPEEGERKYGKVKFADEKNKKYPIDTEAHIRAAWNYFNKAKNAAKYSPEDVKTIKARIIAAWKDKIDPAGPPSAPEAAEKLGKADLQTIAAQEIWDLQDALQALALIAALFEREKWNDFGPVAQEQLPLLCGALKNLQAFIAAEVMEAEEEKAGLAKAGARHSKADQEHIQHIHDRSVHLGADCSGAAKMAKTPTDEEEDMEKLEEVLKGQEDILKRMEALEKENQELLARLKKVEDQPAAPGKTRVVTKEGDLPPGSTGPATPEPEDALGAIKKAHGEGPHFVI
jgi:phage head maturation protease